MPDEIDKLESTEAPTPARATCRCGNDVASPAVVPEARYSVLGTLTLIYGVTARPKAIDFRCTRCGQVVHKARDEKTIREHTT